MRSTMVRLLPVGFITRFSSMNAGYYSESLRRNDPGVRPCLII